jgi:hypothetical protein
MRITANQEIKRIELERAKNLERMPGDDEGWGVVGGVAR